MSKTEQAAPNAEKFVGQFVALRDKLKAMDAAHEEIRKPLREAMDVISGRLTEMLEATGSEAMRTPAGTVYTTTRYTASLADPDAFMTHVVSTHQFDLLDRKANATAVREYVEEHHALPPGCNLNSVKTVGIRRA